MRLGIIKHVDHLLDILGNSRYHLDADKLLLITQQLISVEELVEIADIDKITAIMYFFDFEQRHAFLRWLGEDIHKLIYNSYDFMQLCRAVPNMHWQSLINTPEHIKKYIPNKAVAEALVSMTHEKEKDSLAQLLKDVPPIQSYNDFIAAYTALSSSETQSALLIKHKDDLAKWLTNLDRIGEVWIVSSDIPEVRAKLIEIIKPLISTLVKGYPTLQRALNIFNHYSSRVLDTKNVGGYLECLQQIMFVTKKLQISPEQTFALISKDRLAELVPGPATYAAYANADYNYSRAFIDAFKEILASRIHTLDDLIDYIKPVSQLDFNRRAAYESVMSRVPDLINDKEDFNKLLHSGIYSERIIVKRCDDKLKLLLSRKDYVDLCHEYHVTPTEDPNRSKGFWSSLFNLSKPSSARAHNADIIRGKVSQLRAVP